MKLRYIVESSFIPSFTSSKSVNSVEEADIKVEAMRHIKTTHGDKKYTNFLLYSDDEILIKNYSNDKIPK